MHSSFRDIDPVRIGDIREWEEKNVVLIVGVRR